MARSVTLPPNEPSRPDGTKAAGWWHEVEQGGKLMCDLCPRGCVIAPGKRGFCFVRQNVDGQIVSTTYGRSTGFCIDPIEKKPLNQFYPGTSVLSFGTAGCNLGCKFCQNWTSTKSRQVDAYCEVAEPEAIAAAAVEHGCRSVAFTYNDPIVFAEYAIDTARACHALGVKTVAVTNGYITPAARGPFFEVMDAANVDLKAFSEEFYWKLTGGHLQNVLDTLRWLVHESQVWLEITNLIIPGENDSPEEIERMCAWIAAELGPDVPLHFSAFHPDFQMTDRAPTPPATLGRAYDLARQAGLHYVYTGNVSDRRRQSTYCPACGQVVIERDGYNLGVYALDGAKCSHCGAQVAGRFDARPGDWGSRRLPIRIPPVPRKAQATGSSDKPEVAQPTGLRETQHADPRNSQSDRGDARPAAESDRRDACPTGPQQNSTRSKGGDAMPSDRAQAPEPGRVAPERPVLTSEQEALVFKTAARRVVAAVNSLPGERLDVVLDEAGAKPVLGAFVSLKRGGQLRSCCGYLGESMPLYVALDHAAVRAARDDPRFPPISPSELEHLDMEVWILWGLEPVTARGRDRARAITIGKHGLQIARGAARGLLLPGVAVEHHLDAEGFLEAVCRKAGLPGDAWLDDETTLMTFEGYAISGRLDPGAESGPGEVAPGGPTQAEVAALAAFCRRNVLALLYGATPSMYLVGGFDANVCGAALSVQAPGTSERVEVSRVALRAEMPLQSGLFDLVQAAAQALQARRVAPQWAEQMSLGLSVFWDSAMHGTVAEPALEGLQGRRRAVMVLDRGRWALAFDPDRSPQELLAQAVEKARLTSRSRAAVCSLEVRSTEPRLLVGNVPRPQAGPEVRPPAAASPSYPVAGFYPANPRQLDQVLDELLPKDRQPEKWQGAMVPHAGWQYSGRLAARVFSRLHFPHQVIIVSPRHRQVGAAWSVAPHQTWALPGRDLDSDPELAQRLADAVDGLELDAAPHAHEHAIEVQLPLVARLAPESRVVGIALAIQSADLEEIQRFAEQMAGVLGELPERPLLVISTDMNHYASEAHTRRVDRMALDCIEALDPARLYRTVTENRISMCGLLPAVAVMETLRRLDSLSRCELVGYTTSAEASGDTSRVVGYAGMLFA